MITRLARRFKKVNWKYLLTEVLLIVIGINVGLWFNSISKKNDQRQLEREVLTEMLSALRNDKADIQENYKIHNDGVHAASRLLVPADSLKPRQTAVDLVELWRYSYFAYDNTSYETLKNYGLQLVRNTALRKRIVGLYTTRYRGVEEATASQRRRTEKFEPLMIELFDYRNNQYVFRDPGLTSVTDKSYQIRNLQTSHYFVAQNYREQIIPYVDTLINMLEIELR